MGGRKPTETMTTETEDNTEILAREECARLARQLRLMENDKKAYLEESNAAINQQKKTISSLEEENRQIQIELASNKTRRSALSEGNKLTNILNLVDQYLALESEVKIQTTITNDTEKQLTFAEARLAKLKAKIEYSHGKKGKKKDISSAELDNKEFIAKKKLETVTSQFDAIVAENTKLREHIDSILKENARVMKRCAELDEISMNNKAEIDDLVDQASNAYDQREEAVAKANALHERNEKEKKQFVLEISELKRLIRNEEKLLDFMSTKNQDRTFLETDDERLSRLESAKEQTMDDALESYRDNLSKLLTKDSPTLISLVDEYSHLWTDNINRFHYINELNNEIDTLTVEVDVLRDEIKRCASETVERNQEKTAEITRKQLDLEQMKEELVVTEEKAASNKLLVDDIVKLIERMFAITDFEDAKPVLELIGSRQEISSQNSILYLNILESRIYEIINSFKRGGSGRVTPKSPRPQTRSDVGTPRPRIIISERGNTLEHQPISEEEPEASLLEEEPSPLQYFMMRGKLLDSISIKSTSDTEA